MKYIINKIIMLNVWLSQKIAIYKLIKNHSINNRIIYYKNNNFQEEVWIDKNLMPHFTSLQFKGINIDFGDMVMNIPHENKLIENENEIKKINIEIQDIKNKRKNFKLPINIEIRKVKK